MATRIELEGDIEFLEEEQEKYIVALAKAEAERDEALTALREIKEDFALHMRTVDPVDPDDIVALFHIGEMTLGNIAKTVRKGLEAVEGADK